MSLDFSSLKGKIFISVIAEHDIIKFIENNGQTYEMYHVQDCCEHVYVESIVGDLTDLIESPILLAEEATSGEPFEGKYGHDSFTWTFYKLATRKGYVDIRWLGESNGYYSESVSLYKGDILSEKELKKISKTKKNKRYQL